MGIKGLSRLIKTKYSTCISKVHLSNYKTKRVLLDTSNYLYKFKATNPNNFLYSFFNLIKTFKKNEVHSCFVFDGKAPIEKNATLQERKKQKMERIRRTDVLRDAISKYEEKGTVSDPLSPFEEESPFPNITNINLNSAKEKLEKLERENIKITADDISDLKTLITLCGAKYLDAPGETEPYCGLIQKNTEQTPDPITAVFSDDTDLLVYGMKELIIDCRDEICTVINLDKLLILLDMPHSEFVDFCIMCGSDYNKNIEKVGPVGAYNAIKKYHSIENYENEMKKSPVGYKRSRELMTVTDGETEKVEYWESRIDEKALFIFLNSHGIPDYGLELFKPIPVELV
jgi:5'-3' exonuclease